MHGRFRGNMSTDRTKGGTGLASIIRRNDSYFIMVSGGYDAKGKQIRKTMSWKSEPGMTDRQIEKAVNEQAVFFEKRVQSGQWPGRQPEVLGVCTALAA